MTQILDEIYDAIEQVDREGLPHSEWPVYVPKDRMGEVNELRDEYRHMDVYKKGSTIAGKEIIPDPFVPKPIVLPKDTGDIPMPQAVCENPPRELLEQVVDCELKSFGDKLRERVDYRTKVFFEVEDIHERLNDKKIAKYNLSLSKIDTNKQPDYLERVKFGVSYFDEYGVMQSMDTLAREKLIERAYENIHSVQREAIHGTRHRTLKGPYPVLDIHHTERIRCGTKYTHFGGVFLKRIDTTASKMDLLSMGPGRQPR